MRSRIKLRMRMVAFAGLILSAWTGAGLLWADCHQGPWAEWGRFGYGDIQQLAYSPDGVHVAVAGSGG